MINILKRCKSNLIYTFYFTLFLTLKTLAQDANELIITEIMADPTPARGLPEKEYIELYNRSDKSINLNQFTLAYNNSTARFPDVIIDPKEYLIVVHRNNEAEFQPYGKVIGLSNFSLLNAGTTLSLRDRKNKTLFSVTYTDKWYTESKTQGFSLEMIDTSYPCVETGNWVSSEATLQGTPGKENSVGGSISDLTPPVLHRYEFLNSTQIRLVYNEKLDSVSAVSPNAYAIDRSLKINQIAVESPENKSVILSFQTPLQENITYTLTAKNIADCSGNVLKEASLPFGFVGVADSGEVVLSEILFNPRSGGEDFVEIYNRTDKFISLKDWGLGNVDGAGVLANIKPVSSFNYILQPKQFLVLTRNSSIIKNQYFKAVYENMLEMESLPSFPDKNGTVILLNQDKKIFDRLDYSETMHHGLIDDKAGVSLEKADYNLPSNQLSNWHSAAASEGYATPGYANSQRLPLTSGNAFAVEPEIFTPDGDGMNDETTIKFQLDQYGFVANVYVFDVNGRMLKQLAQNQVLGVSDTIEWNGKSSDSNIAPVGYYIILAQLFHTNGEKIEFKAKVVLGSKY